jgi:hypothetical protein
MHQSVLLLDITVDSFSVIFLNHSRAEFSGWGFMVGVSLKDVMIFIMDDNTLEASMGDGGVKCGGQAEVTLGPFGRSAEVAVHISNKGAGGTVSVSFSKGAFGGISLETGIIAPRTSVNQIYYNSTATPEQIIMEDAVTIPEGSLIPQIYKKLNKLASGETGAISEEDKKQVSAALEEAEKAAEEANKASDVVKVDAEAEAKKEAASS